MSTESYAYCRTLARPASLSYWLCHVTLVAVDRLAQSRCGGVLARGADHVRIAVAAVEHVAQRVAAGALALVRLRVHPCPGHFVETAPARRQHVAMAPQARRRVRRPQPPLDHHRAAAAPRVEQRAPPRVPLPPPPPPPTPPPRHNA